MATTMALGTGIAEVQQHATGQQEKPNHNIAVSKSIVAGESPQKQSDHEKPYSRPPKRKRNRDVGIDTAYAKDTDVMEVNYIFARNHALDPLYNATQVAPILATLASHNRIKPKTTTTETKTKTTKIPRLRQPRSPPPPPPPPPNPTPTNSETNPFALPPSALPTWHHGRTALSNPTYFYTAMQANFPSPDEPRPESEERFAVRSLAKTLEIEQRLADLRVLLMECHRSGDDAALEGLRVRVEGAVEGLVREGGRWVWVEG